MNSMKIMHFMEGRCNPESANGVDKTIYYLARAQASLGHAIHIVCETDKEPVPIEGVVIHRVPRSSLGLHISREVRDLIDAIRPDFGHFHSAYVRGNIGISRYLRHIGIPYAVTPNGNCSRSLLKRRPWLKIPYKLLLERPYMNRAAFVHSVGDAEEIRHYGITVPIVEALNGIDRETLPRDLQRGLIQRTVPAFKDRFVIAFIGRLDIEQKGLDLLINAVADLRGDGTALGILLIGPEWKGSRARICQQIQSCGVEDNIHLYGPAYGSEKYSLLAEADAFIYPSRWEGLPFAVIEAMAAGKLCLVTPASDPAGLLQKHKAGIVFPISHEGIAEGIRRAMNLCSEERDSMLQRSERIVNEEMDWNTIAQRILDAYAAHPKS